MRNEPWIVDRPQPCAASSHAVAIVGLHLCGGAATPVGAFGKCGEAGVRCPTRCPAAVRDRPAGRTPGRRAGLNRSSLPTGFVACGRTSAALERSRRLVACSDSLLGSGHPPRYRRGNPAVSTVTTCTSLGQPWTRSGGENACVSPLLYSTAVRRSKRPSGYIRRASDLGAAERTRTPNLLIRSQMLYPLSYGRFAACSPAVPGNGLNSTRPLTPACANKSLRPRSSRPRTIEALPRARGVTPGERRA